MTDAVLRSARGLAGGVLPIQGPPGTGKTRTAAELVLGLLADGLRVGICAFSHNAVGALLAEVAERARGRGQALHALQRAEPAQACPDPAIGRTSRSEAVEEALAAGEITLAAGTPWLFARAAMRESLDVLVVDEAGQLSLANVTAIGAAATSLVLFGDPQQLAQPIKGTHPPGAEVSALEHLLQGLPTVPPERGILLDTTHRMHPVIAGFVSRLSYQGRLGGSPGLERQRVGSAGPLSGSGLRWVPIDHRDNVTSSPQEAHAAAELVEAVLADGVWTDERGVTRPLTPADLLLLTPYNQQVHRMRRALCDRLGSTRAGHVRVGTVDAMQGRQAAVVLYSLACSSADQATRGVEFLYSLNRLTVALSRARGVVALLASPALLLPEVHSPGQLRRVDALCRFADEAQTVALSAGG